MLVLLSFSAQSRLEKPAKETIFEIAVPPYPLHPPLHHQPPQSSARDALDTVHFYLWSGVSKLNEVAVVSLYSTICLLCTQKKQRPFYIITGSCKFTLW